MGKGEKTGLGRLLVKHHNQMIQQSKEKGTYYRSQQKKVLESVTEVNDIDAVIEQTDEAHSLFSSINSPANLSINLDLTSSADIEISPEERREQQKKEEALHASSLRIPRRPPWNAKMSVEELDANEKRAFLEWRRILARSVVIWVIVDRLTKSAHFLPVKTTFSMTQYAYLYIREIVRLHGIPVSIVSDRDTRFTSSFWKSLHAAMGTKLLFSTAFHPQTDGKSEREIKILEDFLRACMIDFQGSWEPKLPFVEFTYNNSYQSSIGMAPYEALYGRKCRSPLHWDEVDERAELGPEIVQHTTDVVVRIRERMKTAQSRQKSYADKRRRDLEFAVGDHVFVKIAPMKGVMRFGKKGKLSPRFIGPFEILDRVGTLAYRVALPPSLSGVHNVFHISMLRKYMSNPSYVLNFELLQLTPNLSYEEKSTQILGRQERRLQNKVIKMVKVKWLNHSVEEATWETEADMRSRFPELFGDLNDTADGLDS